MEPRYPRLNVGCGRDLRDGWVNLDRRLMGDESPDYEFCRFDLTDIGPRRKGLIPYPESSFEEIAVSHLLEHLPNPLEVMGELYRVAKPDCRLQVNIPYGASDDAWEDQTHLRVYYEGSWQAFAQPYYWRADYGYYGDWRCSEVVLIVEPELLEKAPSLDHAMQAIKRYRNFVFEMIAELHAVKPARPQQRLVEPDPLSVILIPVTMTGVEPEPEPLSTAPAIDMSGPETWDVATRSPQS